MVEHKPEELSVGGSIPPASTKIKRYYNLEVMVKRYVVISVWQKTASSRSGETQVRVLYGVLRCDWHTSFLSKFLFNERRLLVYDLLFP